MKTKLKDVLHLYLGCQVKFIGENRVYIKKGETRKLDYGNLHTIYNPRNTDFLPILRPLSDIKKEDFEFEGFSIDDGFTIEVENYTGGYSVVLDSDTDDGYCISIDNDGSTNCICKDNGQQYPYNGALLFTQLLKQGFDLFGLIESGQAIDKTILTK